jgi:hypothetical protein
MFRPHDTRPRAPVERTLESELKADLLEFSNNDYSNEKPVPASKLDVIVGYTTTAITRLADTLKRSAIATERIADSTERLTAKRQKIKTSRASIPISVGFQIHVLLKTKREQGLFLFVKDVATTIGQQHDDVFDWESYQFISKKESIVSDPIWCTRHVYQHLRSIRFATQYALNFIRVTCKRPRLLFSHLMASSAHRSIFTQMVIHIYSNVLVNAGIKYSPVSVLTQQEFTFSQLTQWFKDSREYTTPLNHVIPNLSVDYTPWSIQNEGTYGTDPLYSSFLQLCCEAVHTKLPPGVDIASTMMPYIHRFRSNIHGFVFESSFNIRITELAHNTNKSETTLFETILKHEQLCVMFVQWIACHYYITKQQQTTTDAREQVTKRILTVSKEAGDYVISQLK